MRCLQVADVGFAEVVDRSTPIPLPGQVLLQVLSCGICGTDRHILAGEYPSHLPIVLGHEFGGRIVQASAGRLRLDPLISRVITLEEVPDVLSRAPGEGDIKYVVDPCNGLDS